MAHATRDRGLPVVPGATMAQIGGGFAGGANGAYIVILAVELGTSPGSLGWIASTFGFGLIAVALTGRWLLRGGGETLLRVASGLGAASAVVLATMPGLSWVIPAALGSGLSGAALLLASTTLLRGRAAKVSLVLGFASGASLVAPAAIGVLELSGIAGGWALLLPVPLLVLVAVLGVRTQPPAAPTDASPGTSSDAAAGLAAPAREPGPTTGPESAPVSAPRSGVHVPAAVAAWSSIVLVVAAEFCFFIWGVARLEEAGLGTGFAAVAGVAFPLGMVVGRFAGARLPDVGPAGMRGRVRLAALVTAVATLAVVLGPWPAILVGLLVAGLALSTTYPQSLALLVSTPGLPLKRATTIGALGSGVAISITPIAMAAVAGALDLQLAFLMPLPLVALAVVATLPHWYTPRPRPTDLPGPRSGDTDRVPEPLA